MKVKLLCLFLALGSVTAWAARPNVVVITASNLGYSDLGCYGGDIRTPTLDKLASEGVQFTQFYSLGNGAMSQTALMTGQAPHRVGMGYPLVNLQWKNYRGSVNDDTCTLAEFFQSIGYTTLASGKWNLTEQFTLRSSQFAWPLNRGVERFYGTIYPQTSYFEPSELMMNKSAYPLSPGYYHTYAIGREAAHFLNKAPRNKPFFLYVAFTAPSWPLQAPPEEIQNYRNAYRGGWDVLRADRFNRMKRLGVVSSRTELSPRDERVVDWSRVGNYALWQSRRMEVYAAQVAAMDRSIGEILDALRQIGAEDDTLIIFLSDAGACGDELSPKTAEQSPFIPDSTRDGSPLLVGNSPQSMPGGAGVFQSYGVPWANVSNTPFRGYAGTLYEGGIASPCIMHWGANIDPGKVLEPACVLDIFPTLVELSDAAFPKQVRGKSTLRPVGKSLVDLFSARKRVDILADENREERYFFWECQGNAAIRHGKWKLVRSRTSGKWELFNITLDRGETQNLYDTHYQNPQILDMIAKFEQWRRVNGVYDWNDVRNRYRQIQAQKAKGR